MEFQTDVNRILERNGIAFELVDGGGQTAWASDSTRRSAQRPSRKATDRWTRCWRMPRGKFLNRDIEVRRESLERLRDAWEPLRTLEQGRDRRRRLKPCSIMSQESRPSGRSSRTRRMHSQALETTS